MIYQYIAGHTLDFYMNIIREDDNFHLWKDVLRFLSYFEVETNEILDSNTITPETAVIENIISRGIPTKASLFVENELMKTINWTVRKLNKKIGTINYELNSFGNERKQLLLKSLAIIDPRLHPMNNHMDRLKFNIQTWENHPDPGAEEKFLYELIPCIVGNEFIIQLLEPQREIDSILKFGKTAKDKFNNQYPSIKDKFYLQRTDFSIQFPVSQNDSKNGMVIEIDGFHHDNPTQKILDELRDQAVRDVNWYPTQRIKTSELSNIPLIVTENINSFLQHPYSILLRENYNNPLYLEPDGLNALQLALTPIGISRIQKLIIKLLNSGYLDLNSDQWNIAVIERDIPCVYLALEDLKLHFKNLALLSGSVFKFPKINFRFFNSKEFNSCSLFLGLNYQTYHDNITNEDFRADILIDISVLQKRSFSKASESFISSLGNPKVFNLRSAYSPKSDRTLAFSNPIYYKELLDVNGVCKDIKRLKYFIRNIFRKIGLRAGQIEILNRALQRKSVIALLPTGAGKSLTYQFASLLQPGITLVIDPIKSLMKDQNDNLISTGIDSTVFINSSIKSTSERKDRIDKMLNGYYHFVFISPERLQIEEFRAALLEMPNNQKYFSYCVIDEAHCVSEWGHDFRTAYLKLGDNSREYCKTADGREIPLLGLTGTASFDVLSDVRRELALEEDPESIIRPKSSERKELSFEVIQANNAITSGKFWDNWNSYAAAKKESLIEHLLQLPAVFNIDPNNFFQISSNNTKCGLIFCPHVENIYGVKEISNYIKDTIQHIKDFTDIYAGSLGDDQVGAELLELTQDKYKNNDLLLLVATKAFGMGIDKPNIRYTFHFNMPHSIEAFYQEAGRAGRDKDPSKCYILYTGLPVTDNITIDKQLLISFWENAFKGEEKEKRIIFELLNKISYPEKKLIDEINEQIQNDFLYPVRLNNFIGNNIARLYINGLEFEQKYGYFDYNTDTITIDTSNVNITQPDCENLLNEIIKYLNDNKPDNYTLREWLTRSEFPDAVDGIERILDKLNVGDPPQFINVGFENDKFKRISDILLNYNNIYTPSWVKQKSSYCKNFDEFRKKIGNNNINHNDILQLTNFFNKIRSEQDTFKAIYRLSIIGVIDESSVDYNSKSIKIKIKKRADKYYIEQLQNYVSRYVSKQITSNVPVDINNRPGNTTIQKCLGYLINFIYDNIARKRKQAIDVMEEACNVGIIYGNKEFGLFINTYFDSKYYVPLSVFLNDYDINPLFKFLTDTEGTKDNLLHLIGACNRLLIENPDNGLFIVLKASADILYYEDFKTELLNDLQKGWEYIKNYSILNQDQYTEYFSRYYKIIFDFNNDTRFFLDRIILLNHFKWLQNNNII